MDKSTKYKILRYNDEHFSEIHDEVIVEFPLTIFINNIEYKTLLCTPEYLKELVIGNLKSEFIIEELDDIKSIVIDESKGISYVELFDLTNFENEFRNRRYITSGCANSAIFYDVADAIMLKKHENDSSFNIENIIFMMSKVNKGSELFKNTGGVHIASLFDKDNLIVTIEDIGRHNAVDKIIGTMISEKIDPNNKIMIVSGRISSDMVLKCAKNGIDIIVSRSAPMDKAIDIANKLNITLAGFVRGKKANIYSGFSRIKL